MAKLNQPRTDDGSDEPEIPSTPETDISALLAQVTQAVMLLAERQSVAPTDQNAELLAKLAAAMDRIADSQIQGSKLIADEAKRAHRPSNEVVPMKSVYNRRGKTLEGYVKPILKCPMMVPWFLDNDSLTREEVELCNLLEMGEFTLTRIDRSKVKVVVKIEYAIDNITPSRLLLNHETAFNNDNAALVPALSDFLRQILRQSSPETRARAAAVLSDEEEEAMIEAGEILVSV